MTRQPIQVFACDHHCNYEWKLPFIRLGNNASDAIINTRIDPEISLFSTILSEGAQMWHVWKHLEEFGNPEYVGFCHYRRFFGKASVPVHDVSEEQLEHEHIFTPFEQYEILRSNSLDGLTMFPLNVIQKMPSTNYTNVIEQTKMISDRDGLGMSMDVLQKAFDLFLENAPADMKPYLEKAFLNDNIYVCNIFTMKSELFRIYGKTIFPTYLQLADYIKDKDTSKFHKRWMGYVLERFTSSMLYAFQYAGCYFIKCPLITVNGWKHEQYERHVGD